ncbi:MAG: porin [Hylemonella sp.]|nr:porin [Hylemonella sp.]
MKKTLIAVAALAATASFAQVSVYGRLDAGYANTTLTTSATTESKRNGIESHNAVSSLWGIKGSEDLGGGMKATFNLEQDIYVANGNLGVSGAGNGTTSAANMSRQANVGLSGGFGSVSLGRNSSLLFGIGASSSYFGATRLDIGNLYNADSAGSNVANSVVYSTPNMSGFTAAVLYGTTDTSSTVSDTKSTVTQGTLRYASGPLQAGIGFGNNSSYAGGVGVPEGVTKGTSLFGAYNFGVAEVRVGMIARKASTAAASPIDTEDKETNVQVSVPMGKATLLAGIGNNTRTITGGADSKGSDYVVGVNYALSKQTYVYGRVGTTGKFDASTGTGGNIAEQKTVGSAVGLVVQF